MSLTGCGMTQSKVVNKKPDVTPAVPVTCSPIKVKDYYPKRIDKPDFSSNEKIIESYRIILDAYNINSNRLLTLINKVKEQNKQCSAER